MSIDPLQRWLVAASFALVTLWSPSARAEDQQAILSLSVNKVEQGEVLAVLRGDDVLVERRALEAAGLRNFTAAPVNAAGHDLVSLASIRPAMRFVVDEENVALRIDAPIETLPVHEIDLSTRPPDVSYERRTSVFLNYGPTVTAPTTGPVTASAFFESGLSEANRLWYSGFHASTTTGAARGLTSLTIDDKPSLIRLTLGDTNVAAGAIGGAAIMGGVTLARDFALDPYFIRFPSMRFTSTTDVPARVDVYVNGVRVRSEAIDPGTFTLDKVRGLVGAGTVRYVVTDMLGRAQQHSTPYYVGISVLAKGVSDFALSAGFPRDRVGAESFDYQGPALIGYYQRGITDAITAGARVEARLGRLSAGPSIATATPFGLFSLEAGASAATEGRTGTAATFSYQYLSRFFNAGASLRALSSAYATSTLTPEMDRSLYQASAFVSVPAGKKASLGSEFAVDVHRDLPLFARVGILLQAQLARELTLLCELALVTETPPRSSLDGFLSLLWAPDSRMNATAGAQKTGNVVGANLQVSKPATFGEDWSMAAAIDLSRSPHASVNHQLQTSVNTVSTYFDWRPEGLALTVAPAGSIVWVKDAGFFPSRPIFDSMGLVRVPNVKGVRVYMNSQVVGRTNASGNLLVPSLISYYGLQLKIASEDIPLEYTVDQDTVVLAAPRRGAAFAEFRARRAHYYRGKVRVLRNGVPEVPAFGDLAVDPAHDEIDSPIGVDGSFELEGLAAGTHHAEVRHKSAVCRFTFVATEADAPLIDLGVLTCEAR